MSFRSEDGRTGYGRPPKEHQFKKGQSGNPKGRPRTKGTCELNVDDILDKNVEVRSGGKAKAMDRREAELRMQIQKAAKGDISALKYVFSAFKKYDAIAPPRSQIMTGVLRVPICTLPSRLISTKVDKDE